MDMTRYQVFVIQLMFIYLVYFDICASDRKLGSRVIATKFGKLRGLLLEVPKLPSVEAYLGLQYASVLGRELRFLPPTGPMEEWSGVRVAITHRPVCPQKIPDLRVLNSSLPRGRIEQLQRLVPYITDQSEECLNLNLYVPHRDNNGTEHAPLSAVVFIHGEAYDLGTGNAYDGSVLSSYGQIIVVTLNYRLGPLGFLSTGDHNAPGNYALMDIVAALQWLRENIHVFGGDPGNISLMGQGHGAALVNLLLVSPVNVDGHLVKRGIVMSGSALSPWAITQQPRYYTKELADLVNCSRYIMDSPQLLKCFKVKPIQLLVNMSSQIRSPKFLSIFGPVVHYRSVIPSSVVELMNKAISAPRRDRRSCQLMVGVMKHEGLMDLTEHQLEQGLTSLDETRVYRTYVNNIYTNHRQRIYDIIRHHYTSWDSEATNESRRNDVMDMLGDSQYVAPSIDLARRHAQRADTYVYTLTYPSRADGYPRWAGGVHGEDLSFVFGAPLAGGLPPFPSTYTRTERTLSEAVMTYWSNFIKTGNPNDDGETDKRKSSRYNRNNKFMDRNWPTYDEAHQRYLQIDPRPDIRRRYRARQVSLWLDLIPKLHESEPANNPHLLNDYWNSSLYLHGTREVDIHFVAPPLPPAPPTPTTLPTDRPGVVRQTTKLWPTSANFHGDNWKEGTWREDDDAMTVSPLIRANGARTNTDHASRSSLTNDSPIALSIIIVVGCILVFLNVLVFAIVYYQRDKKRNQRCKTPRATIPEAAECPKHSDVNTPILSSHHSTSNNHVGRINHHILHADTRTVHAATLPKMYDTNVVENHTMYNSLWSHDHGDYDKKNPLTVV